MDMTNEREAKILESAIERFGQSAQILKAIEELSELTTELARYINFRDNADRVREELADANIGLNQLQLIFGDVSDIEIPKLERLEILVGLYCTKEEE